MKHAVNPHARRMKEDAEESARLTDVARKRDAARRAANTLVGERDEACQRLDEAADEIMTLQDHVLSFQAAKAALRYAIASRAPDANEHMDMRKMRFFRRIWWAIGVAWTGLLRWERCKGRRYEWNSINAWVECGE